MASRGHRRTAFVAHPSVVTERAVARSAEFSAPTRRCGPAPGAPSEPATTFEHGLELLHAGIQAQLPTTRTHAPRRATTARRSPWSLRSGSHAGCLDVLARGRGGAAQRR